MSATETRQQKLGRLIREAREAKHKSQTWLGQQIGSSQSYVSKIENGQWERPLTLRRLTEIAVAVDRDVNTLLVDSGWPDVSSFTAEVQEMLERIGGLSGARAEVVQVLTELPDEGVKNLYSYARHLWRTVQEDGPDYELVGEDGEMIRLYRDLPPPDRDYVRSLIHRLADRPRELNALT